MRSLLAPYLMVSWLTPLSPPTDTAHQYNDGKGSSNSMETKKKEEVGMAKHFSKKHGNKG